MLKRLKLFLWLVAGIALAALSAILVMDNGTPIRLRLVAYETPEAPVFVWLFVALGVGLVAGFALASVGVLRGRVARRRLRRERDDGERELRRLRDPGEEGGEHTKRGVAER